MSENSYERILELAESNKSDSEDSEMPIQLIQRQTSEKFEEFQDESGKLWESLPDSVIGTLIYFLLIENNDSEFKLFETLKYLFYIGSPVYFTFFLQIVMILELYRFLATTDPYLSYCKSSSTLLVVIMAVFAIFIHPSIKTIINESYIVLKAERAAFLQDKEFDDVTIQPILAPRSKRILIWSLVILPEALILLFVIWTGVAYVLTSEGIDNIIINSVSVHFVMDVDNMAREAFQTDSISEHVDSMVFDTSIDSPDEELNCGQEISKHISDRKISTFCALDKVFVCLIISLVVTFTFVRTCYTGEPIVGTL